MYQFHDPPTVNSRRKISQLFQPQNIHKINRSQSQALNFVPFNNQRDKLGRLISRQTNERTTLLKQRHPSLQLNKINPQITNHHKNNDQYALNIKQINNRQQDIKSDRTVERHFRLNQVKNQKQKKVKEMKLRIINSAASQKIQMPESGNYEITGIVDKIKFKKVKQVAISEVQPKTHRTKQTKKQNKIFFTLQSTKNIQSNPLFQPEFKAKKVELDYNLPQLDRYHQLKKLKMMHYDDFQEDHQKFKNLVRSSLVLAQKIKKGLQLD